MLDENEHGLMLTKKGILYAPDFLINAGGLINVYSEYTGYNRENAMADTEKIFDTTLAIYDLASNENIHTQLAATKLAQKRIDDILSVQSTY
jgi:leucine dehydrogenase